MGKVKKFILVTCDYFTKWAEAEPTTSINAKPVEKFLWKHIICSFGIPKAIVTDHGRQFDCRPTKSWCLELGIDLRFSSVAYPQVNGQTEAVNKITTGETPFNLTYGMEAVIPVEIGISSPRLETYSEESNETEIRSNLDLLEEVREKARLHQIVHQQTTARHFNDKVKLRPLQVGDLVLRLNQFKSRSSEGKLKESWEGSYQISNIVGPGAYKIRIEAGKVLPNSFNARHLKKYYH
ncbi:Rve domain-containing protein [Quillaja saponaria]|uniref:Rve domain-containing protein n=1 Tax=Quillaja saponaria TaxID=32244 RepID=A0AAD7KN29_QUISA|nr:Rve domain-containing protein [Quillaja saponaria]